MVWYVPVPITGKVFAGTGTVWKMPTRGIPVPNPTTKCSQGVTRDAHEHYPAKFMAKNLL